jgi:LmbE family N-acetylglucosaminyl deacetylase
MYMDFAILSPHPDDAILSCCSVLDSDRAGFVMNVFAELPEPSFVTSLDQDCGATDSAEFMEARLQDDKRALKVINRRAVGYPFLDLQYRAYQDPSIRKRIEKHTSKFIEILTAAKLPTPDLSAELDFVRHSAFYAPLAIGGHPDHVAVRNYAVSRAKIGTPVFLYADIPYAMRSNWSDWAQTGKTPPEVESILSALPFSRERLKQEVVKLTDSQLANKLKALSLYSTYDALERTYPELKDPELISYEIFWQITG